MTEHVTTTNVQESSLAEQRTKSITSKTKYSLGVFVVRCSLFVVRCSLFVVRCSLFVLPYRVCHMKFEADTLISFYGGLVPAKMFIYRTYVVHF